MWKWVTDHQLAGWIGVSMGALLAALLFLDGRAAGVALVGALFFVLLSLSVNGLLDWWQRRGTTR